jgi:hypothetical protein
MFHKISSANKGENIMDKEEELHNILTVECLFL